MPGVQVDGTYPLSRSKVRVGIVGVGNCASSFVQGLSYYAGQTVNEPAAGLMHAELGGYRAEDIEIATAFDVSAGKVGRDVAEAIFAKPNNTITFAQPKPTGVRVHRGPTLDGIGKYLVDEIEESPSRLPTSPACCGKAGPRCWSPTCRSAPRRRRSITRRPALEAGCAFVNCVPVFIASKPEWRERFEAAGLPIVGDDIKSQVGATIVHRVLANLFRERGVRLDRTYQLNFGGNTDFLNMLERERLASKKISKTQAVTSQLDAPIEPENIHVGPTDFVPWLTDRKFAHIRMEGTTFGGVPLSLELKLEVWDSPNSAGVVIDAVRCAKLAHGPRPRRRAWRDPRPIS